MSKDTVAFKQQDGKGFRERRERTFDPPISVAKGSA